MPYPFSNGASSTFCGTIWKSWLFGRYITRVCLKCQEILAASFPRPCVLLRGVGLLDLEFKVCAETPDVA